MNPKRPEPPAGAAAPDPGKQIAQLTAEDPSVENWLLADHSGRAIASSWKEPREMSAVAAFVASHAPGVLKAMNLGDFTAARITAQDGKVLAIVAKNQKIAAFVADDTADFPALEAKIAKVL